MKIAVITFPGSNCDDDCIRSLRLAGGAPRKIWHRERALGDVGAVVIPGGFAHGDYLRPGAIARFSPIMDAVVDFAVAGGPVAGICNGFQILCESGLLPGALLRNPSLRYQSHDIRLRVERAEAPFASEHEAGEVLRMPLAHADGSYYADAGTLRELESNGRIAFRYCDHAGEPTPDSNPNGSLSNIAGIVNERGNVLGMMPHPDRAVDPRTGSVDGLGIFRSLVAFARGAEAAS